MNNLISVSFPEDDKKKSNNVFFGLDFGTTYSLIAACEDGEAKVLSCSKNVSLFHSSVSVVDGKLVCDPAVHFSEGAFRSVKRFIGRRQSEVKDLVYEMDEYGFVETSKYKFSAFDSAVAIFKKLFSVAKNNYDDDEFFDCVVSVPAYYDDIARAHIRRAAILSGFNVLKILNEPTAAAIACEKNLRDGKYLVYDFGGGTFDLSILEKSDHVIKVIGSFGDSFLGGDDVDLLIALNLDSENANNAEFLLLVKQAKEFVCSTSKEFCFEFLGKNFCVNLDMIEECAKPKIIKTINIMEEALLDLNLLFSDLEGVIFVGGSTYLPGIKKHIKKKFKGLEFVNEEFCRRTSVAVGASLHAFKIKNREGLLIDVVPLSLGIEVVGSVVEKIIHRNSPIPAVASKILTTASANCDEIRFTVCQGESKFLKDNKILKTFYMSNISKNDKGHSRVEVTFRFDVNGLLRVLAKDLISDKKVELSLDNVFEICSDL